MLAQLIAFDVIDNSAPPPSDGEPTAADLKMRYPAFAAVSDATISYWLTDAHRFVDRSWMAMDYAPALLAHAAYAMANAKVAGIAGSDVAGFAASGVTSFKSGTFQAQFSDEAVKAAVAGGYASNPYGIEFAELLYRNKAGTRITFGGVLPCCDGFNGYAGLIHSLLL